MPWSWRYEDADGNEMTPDDLSGETFVTQGDAETWLGEHWRELLEAGVDHATLLHDDSVEYGPMSLHDDG